MCHGRKIKFVLHGMKIQEIVHCTRCVGFGCKLAFSFYRSSKETIYLFSNFVWLQILPILKDSVRTCDDSIWSSLTKKTGPLWLATTESARFAGARKRKQLPSLLFTCDHNQYAVACRLACVLVARSFAFLSSAVIHGLSPKYLQNLFLARS